MKKHEIPANFYQESLFLFENRRLITRLDEINVSINEVSHIFKMQEYAGDSAILKFAFQPKDGLVRINEKKGNVEETNVLFSFIACKNDLRKYIKFFNENGFLFPLSMGEFNEANSLEIIELSKRMSAAVELMSQLSELENKNYKRMLTLTLYLLLSKPIILESDSYAYKSCSFEQIFRIFDNGFMQNTVNLLPLDNDYNFVISDTIFGKTKMHIDIYRHTDENRDDELDAFWHKVFHSYCNYRFGEHNIINKRIIDVLYHTYFSIGQIAKCTYEKIIFVDGVKEDWSCFNDSFKKTLVEVAKVIVGLEINSNLNGIKPEYDIDIMEPRWKVSDLLSAMYFSIFYMRPNIELTRKCENPNCNNYFTVSRTSSRKKFCCQECANAVAQARFRAKKKAPIL